MAEFRQSPRLDSIVIKQSKYTEIEETNEDKIEVPVDLTIILEGELSKDCISSDLSEYSNEMDDYMH